MNIPLWRLTTARRKLAESVGIRKWSKPSYDRMHERIVALFGDQPGYFVEVGAVDGVFESNTYYLERFCGWRGVLIEPVPEMFKRLPVNRPRAQHFHCALVEEQFEGDSISILPAHAMSTISTIAGAASDDSAAPVTVPARTLSSVLDDAAIPSFDLFSLDVEGYELNVLAGLDFSRHTPRYLIIECLDEPIRERTDAVLQQHFEFFEALSYRDYLYKARGSA